MSKMQLNPDKAVIVAEGQLKAFRSTSKDLTIYVDDFDGIRRSVTFVEHPEVVYYVVVYQVKPEVIQQPG
jgi:hypothetical protein